MSVVKLDTGFNIELALPIAQFHKRFFAWVIDLMIQLAYIWIMNMIIEGILGNTWDERFKWLAVILFLPVFLYHLLCEVFMNGQSPGKKALSIKVITSEGGQPSVSQYIIRWAFKTIDFPYWILAGISAGSWPPLMFLFIFSGLACIMLTKSSQRIGDLIAGTVLIDTKSETSWQDTVFVDVNEDYTPVFPQVMQLSDHDINSIKQILVTAGRKQANHEYISRISGRIQNALKIETDMDPVDFMELLLKDYNHLTSR